MDGQTNPVVKANLRQFLLTLPTVDILSLEKTTMNGVTSSSNPTDAITNILDYSDPELILNRKSVTKRTLNAFLHSRRVPEYNPRFNKAQLVKILLNYIGHGKDCPQPLQIPMPPPVSTTSGAMSSNFYSQSQPQTNSYSQIAYSNEPSSVQIEEFEEMEDEDNEPEEVLDTNGQVAGKAFTNWFYSLLSNPGERERKFVPDNVFLPGCQFKAMLVKPNGSRQEHSLHGRDDTCNFYRLLVSDIGNDIMFTPNLIDGENGVIGRMNSFGLLQVQVRGTFLAKHTTSGDFQNTFTLQADPTTPQNNYKILTSVLMLREFGVIQYHDQQCISTHGNLAIGY